MGGCGMICGAGSRRLVEGGTRFIHWCITVSKTPLCLGVVLTY